MSNDRLKFRAWYAGRMYFVCRMWFEQGELNQVFLCKDGDSVADTWARVTDEDLHLVQWTGLYDSEGVEIYSGDVVYLAGYGDYVAEFPFLDLYDGYPEGDIGKIKGNIYENPELLDA